METISTPPHNRSFDRNLSRKSSDKFVKSGESNKFRKSAKSQESIESNNLRKSSECVKSNNFIESNKSKSPPTLALIVPYYNEEEVLGKSLEIFSALLAKLKAESRISKQSFMIFINDGSNDKSYDILKSFMANGESMAESKSIESAESTESRMETKAESKLESKSQSAESTKSKAESTQIISIKLSKNYGHQNALLAGLEYARDKCDCAISIDCDLQQDINKIAEFLEHFSNGSDIVFGVRSDRAGDSAFKKYSALGFYNLMRFFGVNIIKNHADFRLLSNKALNFIAKYKEVNLFLRGIFLEIGLKSSIVHFEVKKRELGKSKYNLAKMLSLALNGITSFSVTPLRLVFSLGCVISIFSGILGLYGLLVAIFSDSAVPGWASIVVPIYFLGGIQMLSLGIIGEYIGKIYSETKGRPRYLIEEILGSKINLK
ncbi:hypothetical protein CCY99_02565 [Helicobacter sp. 16-1353]|nr:hypothetical protein CCY99_02565 [Helicobacter sp. 16-1353]